MLKIALAALLSAALFTWLPYQSDPVNNLESNAAVTKPAKQPPTTSSEHLAQEVKQVETPASQQPETQPEVATPQPLTDKESLMQQAGIPQSDWAATDYIVSHESSWNPTAVNSIGATGLCQALPASKMASAGGDYMTNPVTQLKWCHEYANSRYGGWWSSFATWQAKKWW